MAVGTSSFMVIGILYKSFKKNYATLEGVIVQIAYCFILKNIQILTLMCISIVIFL